MMESGQRQSEQLSFAVSSLCSLSYCARTLGISCVRGCCVSSFEISQTDLQDALVKFLQKKWVVYT